MGTTFSNGLVTVMLASNIQSIEQIDQIYDDAPLKALIIDDDQVYANLLTRFLKKNSKKTFSIEICGSATRALRLCLANSFDILLLDHNLPDLNGAQLLHELRARSNALPPPAIILTSEGGEAAAGQALRADAADYLPKRLVTAESLARSVNNAIEKHILSLAVYDHTVELEHVNKDLKTKNREIQDFYQKISHEVKTPLAAAREFIAIIRDELIGPITTEQAEILDHAIGSCDQIANHFNDLVEITRLDAGKIALHRDMVGLEQLLTRSVASCAAAAIACGVSLEQDVSVRNKDWFVDGDRIIQVLSNLISNAIKYSNSGNTVTLTVTESDFGRLEFIVTDSGCGIQDSDKLKIFDRLYQVNEVSHEHLGCGLGLGLSIAKEIVNLHDGKIWVKSEINVGSEFHFTIPRQEDSV